MSQSELDRVMSEVNRRAIKSAQDVIREADRSPKIPDIDFKIMELDAKIAVLEVKRSNLIDRRDRVMGRADELRPIVEQLKRSRAEFTDLDDEEYMMLQGGLRGEVQRITRVHVTRDRWDVSDQLNNGDEDGTLSP